MKRYCISCDDERHLREERRSQSFVVRGEVVEFEAPVLVCAECGEVVFDPEYDGEVLRTAHDVYRKKHGLLTSGEIAALRRRYGLSQRALARMLGWGEVTIQRYEKGVIQNRAHDEVLRSLQDPRRVLERLTNDRDGLTESERKKLARAAQALLEREKLAWLRRDLDQLLRERPADRFTGFRELDLDRFTHAVTWFAARIDQLPKTKLAKLLWLADFKHFREHGVSITGCAYARLPFGPVPDRFQLLLGLAVESGAIVVEEELFGEYVGDVVRPAGSRDESASLDPEELATLTFALENFGRCSARELSELSHREDVWSKRANGELIPYDEAQHVRALSNNGTTIS